MERLGENSVGEAKCGDGKLTGDGGAEYPCVSRFRHRRLIAFLWLQGFQRAAESMLVESEAILSVPHLHKLVLLGLWRQAIGFLSRFLPLDSERPLSVEAEALHRFLGVHMALADIVAGRDDSTVRCYCQYLSDDRTICYGAVRLRSIILSILYARQEERASIDWNRVRRKAAKTVDDLLYRTPELKDLVYMPARQVKPHHVLPIGFGFRRRSHSRNRTRRPKAYALAKVYLGQQRSLPTISDPSQELRDELSVSKALNMVADIVVDCLQAGKRPESRHVCPLQTSGTEGALVAPVSQNMFGTLTGPAQTAGMPSVANAVTMNAPASQSAVRCLTSTAKNSGLSLMTTNAGAPVSPSMRIMNLASHAENSDAGH